MHEIRSCPRRRAFCALRVADTIELLLTVWLRVLCMSVVGDVTLERKSLLATGCGMQVVPQAVRVHAAAERPANQQVAGTSCRHEGVRLLRCQRSATVPAVGDIQADTTPSPRLLSLFHLIGSPDALEFRCAGRLCITRGHAAFKSTPRHLAHACRSLASSSATAPPRGSSTRA